MIPKPEVSAAGNGLAAIVTEAAVSRCWRIIGPKSIRYSWSPERMSTSRGAKSRTWWRLRRTASAVPWNQSLEAVVCSAASSWTKPRLKMSKV